MALPQCISAIAVYSISFQHLSLKNTLKKNNKKNYYDYDYDYLCLLPPNGDNKGRAKCWNIHMFKMQLPMKSSG